MKKILTLIMASICCLSLFGCNGGNNDGGPNNTGENGEKNPLLTNPIVSLNEFETQKDLNTIGMSGVLGKVEINDEAMYKTSGNGSAKVTVIHDPHDYRNSPVLFQDARRLDRQEDYTDFSKISDVTLSVYNANEAKESIGLQLNFPHSTSLTTWFELVPNDWTHIRYTVPREDIPLVTDKSGNSQYTVTGINMIFNRPESEDNVFYLDNFCLYRTGKEMISLEKTLRADEISSFDQWWQIAEITYVGGNYAPAADWVKNVTADGTGAALKLTALPGASVWAGIRYGQSYLSRVNWSTYSGEDTLNLSLYLPQNQEMDISVGFSYGGNVIYMEQKRLIAGEWNHLSWTVDEINAASAENFSGYPLASITYLDICYRPFSGTKTKEVYIDNIHMQRVTTNE